MPQRESNMKSPFQALLFSKAAEMRSKEGHLADGRSEQVRTHAPPLPCRRDFKQQWDMMMYIVAPVLLIP